MSDAAAPIGPTGRRLRAAAAVLLVVLAAAGAGLVALGTFRVDRKLSVGSVRLSVQPGHSGSLDLFVPIVDWGVRFPAVRLPARLLVEVLSVDRQAAAHLAGGDTIRVDALRAEARDAIASYIRLLIGVVVGAALLVGCLTALAVRTPTGPRLRWTIGAGVATALLCGAALVLLLPPRGRLDAPLYYAHGSDIPRALRLVEGATRSTRTLDEEINAQLVGLARLVASPAGREPTNGLPRLTLASDLHNNVLALPALERAAAGGPLFFVGDLTDQGSPLENGLVRRIVRAGHPLVFVSGNHDSDTLVRDLARDGAVVLTQRGRLRGDGTFGARVVNVGGLRVAGYSDPFERRRIRHYQAPPNPRPTAVQQSDFLAWVDAIEGVTDVIMVHEPQLAALALAQLRDHPPSHALVVLVGHTHVPALDATKNLVVLNGGTVGAGGTGNLSEAQSVGLAVLIYQVRPRFNPIAADLVSIDPSSGNASAVRRRLDGR